MRKLPPAAFELDDAVRLKQEIAAAAFAFRRRIPFPNLRYQHETYPNEGPAVDLLLEMGTGIVGFLNNGLSLLFHHRVFFLHIASNHLLIAAEIQ